MRLERRELWTLPHRCIVSSNSDFTRLAVRIRESGLTVYGFGERKTPKPFVAACDRFIYVDLKSGTAPAEVKPVRATAVNGPTTRGTRAPGAAGAIPSAAALASAPGATPYGAARGGRRAGCLGRPRDR
ncbi:NYN domain-containing protein [Streptomyces sp. 11x1]|nr:NYN domain-containing protein [Streptomyces sp. 11x1]